MSWGLGLADAVFVDALPDLKGFLILDLDIGFSSCSRQPSWQSRSYTACILKQDPGFPFLNWAVVLQVHYPGG
jgi:hypothetical protein